ncbi:helix-turn-helix domain-containing protein [Rothia sp. CCM 9416]|uniref:helix-turn-helix domain-containing protein n=1 Tax=Rothia sp. CCM 9416 TaxID=3402655 RepID=UPI003AD924DA
MIYDFDEKAETKLFGQRLKNLRKKRGITQEELAHTTGLAVSTISRLERGAFTIGVNKLPLLARGLDIPVADFYRELGY